MERLTGGGPDASAAADEIALMVLGSGITSLETFGFAAQLRAAAEDADAATAREGALQGYRCVATHAQASATAAIAPLAGREVRSSQLVAVPAGVPTTCAVQGAGRARGARRRAVPGAAGGPPARALRRQGRAGAGGGRGGGRRAGQRPQPRLGAPGHPGAARPWVRWWGVQGVAPGGPRHGAGLCTEGPGDAQVRRWSNPRVGPDGRASESVRRGRRGAGKSTRQCRTTLVGCRRRG